MAKKKAPRRRGSNGPSKREVMRYIIDNSKRYNDNGLQENARKELRTGDAYQPKAKQESRTKQRGSGQRSAARRRRPAGMSSARTRDVVARQTGLSRENVKDSDILRMRADAYAAFGWGV